MAAGYEELLEDLKKTRLVAVVKIPDPGLALPLGEALLEGGVNWVEIMFRNENTLEALREFQRGDLPIHVGAGTVRTLEQARRAVDAGVHYLVSPGLNPEIVTWALERDIPFFPGVDSTTGIEMGQKLGLKVLKFFPAEPAGGVSWLKAVHPPYYDLQFMPTAGISLQNLRDYLLLPYVIAVGGSFLAKPAVIAAKKFDEITRVCQEAIAIVNNIDRGRDDE